MEAPSFYQYSTSFDWNKETCHPSFDIEDNKIRVSKSKGQYKTVHGDMVLSPGNKYYWEVKLGFGNRFVIGIAPNPIPSIAKPFQDLLNSSFDSDNSKENAGNDNFMINIPEKTE